MQVRRLGLRTETEAEVRASKQQQEADGALPGPHMQWGSGAKGWAYAA